MQNILQAIFPLNVFVGMEVMTHPISYKGVTYNRTGGPILQFRISC